MTDASDTTPTEPIQPAAAPVAAATEPFPAVPAPSAEPYVAAPPAPAPDTYVPAANSPAPASIKRGWLIGGAIALAFALAIFVFMAGVAVGSHSARFGGANARARLMQAQPYGGMRGGRGGLGRRGGPGAFGQQYPLGQRQLQAPQGQGQATPAVPGQ